MKTDAIYYFLGYKMQSIRCLIVGLGIGNLYKNICMELDYNCFTVDTNNALCPTYTNLDQAISEIKTVDISIVALPNFLHYETAYKLAKISKIVLVEKPGVQDAESWIRLTEQFPNTRFMMIKNNQYRDNINELRTLYQKSKSVKINWINKNRIPKPGSWFTTKNLSFGGVSKDLLPHLLSFYTVFESNYVNTVWTDRIKVQRWNLGDLTSTDYGEVNLSGIYDVDDLVELNTIIHNRNISFTADWRSTTINDIGLHFDDNFIELGLCPEVAYKNMLSTAYNNLHNNIFWKTQLEQDIWIHKQTQ